MKLVNLRPSVLRTLAAILLLADKGGPITLRRIGKLLEIEPNQTFFQVHVLLDHGLISMDQGKNGLVKKGSIRPRVRYIPQENLGREKGLPHLTS